MIWRMLDFRNFFVNPIACSIWKIMWTCKLFTTKFAFIKALLSFPDLEISVLQPAFALTLPKIQPHSSKIIGTGYIRRNWRLLPLSGVRIMKIQPLKFVLKCSKMSKNVAFLFPKSFLSLDVHLMVSFPMSVWLR